MAKKRNKKQEKSGAGSMDISTEGVGDAPQAMDTSEGIPSNPALGAASRKIKKGTPMRRTKNLKKLKAVARAISNSEKSEEKVTKSKNKMQRVQSAKSLYD